MADIPEKLTIELELSDEELTFLAQTGHGSPAKAHAEIGRAYLELHDLGPAVSIFGSAKTPKGHPHYKFAYEVARELGEAGYAIITGGGPGIMEAANRGAKDAGVPSVGLHMHLPSEQQCNKYVDVPVIFNYFFCRKIFYVDPASAFVTMPGGLGTLDELFEVMTLIKTSKIAAYPTVLGPSSYWQGLKDWMATRPLENEWLSKTDIKAMHLADSPKDVLKHIKSVARPRRRPQPKKSKRSKKG